MGDDEKGGEPVKIEKDDIHYPEEEVLIKAIIRTAHISENDIKYDIHIPSIGLDYTINHRYIIDDRSKEVVE